MEIPIVDFANLTLDLDFTDIEVSALLRKVAADVDDALVKTGFIYLKNTGISFDKSVKTAFEASEAFFKLDLETKLKYNKQFLQTYDAELHIRPYSGYTPAGAELEADADYEHKESWDITGNHPVFPDEHVPEFQKTFQNLESEFKNLSIIICHLLGIGLELERKDYFVSCLRHLEDASVPNTTTVRALYYPEVIGHNFQKYVNPTRCPPHTDYGFITLLLMQEDSIGLEVLTPEGNWIPANPIPDTVLVNVADMLQLWSDGRYPATIHRVEIPKEEVYLSRSRKTIAYFLNPDDDVMISALSCKTNANGAKVKTTNEVWNSLEHMKKRSVTAYSASVATKQ